MLIPIEYHLRCDNGVRCHDKTRPIVSFGAGLRVLAHSKTEARRKAEAQGWVRRKLGTCGPTVDLCPECAK